MTTYLKPLKSVIIKPSGADCNLNCSYCFYLDRHELYPETKFPRMDDETLDILIGQLMEQSGSDISITWQGGEPALMGLDFFRKVIDLEIKYAKGKNKNIGNCFQTNGTLLNDEWADFLKEYNFLVGLSLDGPAFIHDHYRKTRGEIDTHNKVMAALELLKRKGVEFNILATVTGHSVKHAVTLYNYYKDLGIRWIQFFPVLDTKLSDCLKPASFTVDPVKYGQFLNTIFDLWINDYVHSPDPPVIRLFENIFHRFLGYASPECTFMKNCGVYLVVEHNGDVYSCDFYVEKKWLLGNIRENRLIDLLNSPSQQEFGRMKSRLDKECLDCEWHSVCQGGCTRYRSGGKEGNHYAFCKSMKIFLEHTGPAFQILADDFRKNNPSGETYDLSGHLK